MQDMWWMITFAIVLVFLSVSDIRTRRIPIAGFIVLCILSVMFRLVSDDGDTVLLDWIWSILPGLFLIGIGLLSGGKVGIGDGILIMELGIAFGFIRCMYILTGALFLCCLFSIVLLLFHKGNKKTQIPFVPFITLGLGVMSVAFIQ